jgi:hypothetical protein
MKIASQMKVKVEWGSKVQAIPAALLQWVLIIVCLSAQSGMALGQTSAEPAAIAQRQARAKQLRALLVKDWRIFVATNQFNGLPATERIRQMEGWRARQQTVLAELGMIESQRVDAVKTRTERLQAPSIPLSGNPLLADIVATNGEVRAEVGRINAEATTALDRIEWVEEFLALNQEALAQQDRNRLELARSNPAPTPVITPKKQQSEKERQIGEARSSTPPNLGCRCPPDSPGTHRGHRSQDERTPSD